MFKERINEIINDLTDVKLKKEDFGNLSLIKSKKEVFVNDIKDFSLYLNNEELNEANLIIIYVTSFNNVTIEELIVLSEKVKKLFNKQINIIFGRKVIKNIDYILDEVFLSVDHIR